MKFFCLFCFFILFSFSIVYSQTTVTIRGHIKNIREENMPQMLISIKQVTDSALLKYAISDDNGNYELTYAGKEPDLLLIVSGLGIATQIKKIVNRSQVADFTVKEEDFMLKEVQIKASKIYYNKDTINYLVSAFSNEKDVVNGITYDHLRQDVTIQTFISKNALSLLTPILLENVILRPLFGFDAEINHLTSGLYPRNEQSLLSTATADSLKKQSQTQSLPSAGRVECRLQNRQVYT